MKEEKSWPDKVKKEALSEVDHEKKIRDLEEELKRKDEQIEALRRENEILLKTAFRNSEKKVEARLKKDFNRKL